MRGPKDNTGLKDDFNNILFDGVARSLFRWTVAQENISLQSKAVVAKGFESEEKTGWCVVPIGESAARPPIISHSAAARFFPIELIFFSSIKKKYFLA